jgi:hypothetical protein
MIKRRRGKYGINSNKKRLNEKKVIEILEKLKSCVSHKQLSLFQNPLIGIEKARET